MIKCEGFIFLFREAELIIINIVCSVGGVAQSCAELGGARMMMMMMMC